MAETAEINLSSLPKGFEEISITTTLDMSPCEIVISQVSSTPLYSVGTEIKLDDIVVKITSLEKEWHSKGGAGVNYLITYRAQNDPRLWAEEYSYHFFEYYGKTLAEIITDINGVLGDWGIEEEGAGKYKLRQYDNDSSLTNIIKDIADMLGKVPVLDHKTKKISFENITTYAGEIQDHDFSTSDSDLISYGVVEEELESTGTIVNGVYNAPFYSAVKEMTISLQGTAWNLELLDSYDEGGLAVAEFLATTSID